MKRAQGKSKKLMTWIQKSKPISPHPRKNISLTPEVKVDDPEDTPDILSLERIDSLEIFVREFQERWDPIINQQEVEERVPDEGYQSHEEEKEFTHDSTKDNEDLVEEREPEDVKHEDEMLMCAPTLINPSKILFFLHKKKRIRLIIFPFRFLMMPYSMIQKVKK
jgi:hypothetical protein